MIEKFLFIANDFWFDFELLMKESKGEFYWYQSPKSVYAGSHVYMYLAGKTKAVKYEFEVTEDNVNANIEEVLAEKSEYLLPHAPTKFSFTSNTKLCRLKLVRVIKDLSKTSPKALKEEGKILGTLMSNRRLRPFSMEYLDSII